MPDLLALGKQPWKLCSSLAQPHPQLSISSQHWSPQETLHLDSSSSPQIARAPCSVHMDLVAQVAASRALSEFLEM